MPRILVRTPTPAIRIDLLQAVAMHESPSAAARPLHTQSDILIVDADDAERQRIVALGGVVFDDVQFETFPGQTGTGPSLTTLGPSLLSLYDVITEIGARAAWRTTRGGGVTIAIIDTGISGAMREVPAGRRSSHDLPTAYHGRHWDDLVGHGSMCAAIAAGSTAAGGRYDGVAPDATVLSIRTDLTSSDITIAYDELLRLHLTGALSGPLVVSNSFGAKTCRSPGVLPKDHPFLIGIEAAVSAGIFVCFAAGNNHHDLCSFDPTACKPNTIWGANSHDRIVSVGTVNRALSNQDPTTPHVNSSRGPGEWASNLQKPDCVAPTYGEVPWGSGYIDQPWWGTSGACPQVAGAAALILSIDPRLAPAAVADIVRATCRPLAGGPLCVGHGLLDCERAVATVAATAAV